MVLNLNNPGLGAGVWAIFGFYLLGTIYQSLFILGFADIWPIAVFLAAIRDWFTRRRHKQDDSQHRASSLSDYLASGTSSSLVLTATLMMASQGGFFIYGVPVDAYTEEYQSPRFDLSSILKLSRTCTVSLHSSGYQRSCLPSWAACW